MIFFSEKPQYCVCLMLPCRCRYIAIVHPIKAHLYCSRRRILSAIACFWQASLVFGLPTIIYNTVTRPSAHFPVKLCLMIVPCNHRLYHDIVFKSAEFLLFFLCPILVQVGTVCYWQVRQVIPSCALNYVPVLVQHMHFNCLVTDLELRVCQI